VRGARSPDFPDLTNFLVQTSAALSVFILAMVLYPDVMRKAQNEIDVVVGSGRLPTFADTPHLPYVRAIVMEVLRWRPVGPLG
jgi:cytochrome P450